MLNCPYCGRGITDDDATCCPSCSKPLDRKVKRTQLPAAGGIFTLVSACIALISGLTLAFILILSDDAAFQRSNVAFTMQWSISLLNIVGFGFGAMGGIFSLKRRNFGLSILGSSFLIATGISVILIIAGEIAIVADSVAVDLSVVLYELSLQIPAILGTVFVARSRGEFL